MSKHTQGPWTAHFDEDYFVRGSDGGRVAMMQNLKGLHGLGGRRTGEESAANCRLIAAAPDLLDALNMALDELMVAGFSYNIYGSSPVSDALIYGMEVIDKATNKT